MVSLDHPEILEEGMVFALETYWPAADGWSAARIEEEVVVTADGCEVITKFPAEELLVAGKRYYWAGGGRASCAKARATSTPPPGAAASPRWASRPAEPDVRTQVTPSPLGVALLGRVRTIDVVA